MHLPDEPLLTGTDTEPDFTLIGDFFGPEPYLQEMEAAHTSLKDLRFLLDVHPWPAFITDAGDQTILAANSSAVNGFPGSSLAGKNLSGILCYRQEIPGLPVMVYFNRSWLVLERNPFQWGETECHTVVLKPFPGLPGAGDVQSARDMAALVLHRLRSPLTGMQGYIDLLANDPDSEMMRKRVGKLGFGMEQLNAMLDELEALHMQDREYNPTNIRVASVILDLLRDFEEASGERLEFRNEKESPVIRGSREKLTRLLKILVINALEHPAGKNFPVTITVDSPLRVSITNYGDPVPEYIWPRIFYPFVTDKARHMGLGLTLACQIARQMGITVIPASNSAENGITFSLLLPPN
jgi:hypothetical protein